MKLRVKNVVKIGFAFLSIQLLWMAYNFLLPLYLESDLKEALMAAIGDTDFVEILVGMLMALDNLFALFMIPLVSKWSDNCNAKAGKRMPFIIVGIICAAVSFLFFPLSRQVGILMLVFNVLVVLISMNIYRSPAVALMPDVTIKPFRSQANAIVNVMGGIGTAIGYVLLLSTSALKLPDIVAISGVAVVMIICLIVALFNVNEKKLHALIVEDANAYVKAYGGDVNDLLSTEDEEEVLKKTSTHTKLSGSTKKDFILILGAVFMYYMSANAVETWMSLYSVKLFNDAGVIIFGMAMDGKTLGLILFGGLAVGSFGFMVPAAVVADKYGKRNAMMLGAGIMAASNMIILFFSGFSWFLLLPFLTSGIGMALMISNMYPLTVEYAKQGDFGKYTGFYYITTMLAQSITPALSGLFMSGLIFGSMRPLMPYSAVFMALSFVCMLFVKGGRKTTVEKKLN